MYETGTNLLNNRKYLFTENYIILLREINRTQIDGMIYLIHGSDD